MSAHEWKPVTLHLTSSELRAAVLKLDGARIAQQTLAAWCQRGFVTPSVRWPRRRGRRNFALFGLSDLARVRVIVALRRLKLPLWRALEIVRDIKDVDPEMFRASVAAVLVVQPGLPGRVVVRRPDGELDVDVTAGQGQLLLPIAGVLEGNVEVAAEIVLTRGVA